MNGKLHKLMEARMNWRFWKTQHSDNFYVRVLRWAKEKGSEGFLLSDMDKGLSLTEKQINLIDYTANVDDSVFIRPDSHKFEYKLSFEGYFKLLEYDELQEARASAKQARFYAIYAMLISAISSLIGVYSG